jgi:hypothetical protein
LGVISGTNQRIKWLLIEWPDGETEPDRYWLSTLPSDIARALG